MKKNFTLCLVWVLSFCAASAAGPTVPSSNLQVPAANIDGDRMTITFSKGDGASRIVILKEGSPLISSPVNGTDYTANINFETPAAAFGANDGFVVYKGSSVPNNITVIPLKLKPATTYYISIYEFNGTGSATQYLQTVLSGSATTKAAPTGQATITSITAVTGNKATLNFSAGNGDRRLIIASKGQPVSAVPQDLADYTASLAFGSGSAINTSNYVVYKGATSSAIITNLEPNTTYYFSIFEYNGNQGPVYLTPGNERSVTTNTGPTQASGAITFASPIEGNRLTLNFSPGNGKHQLIIARKGQPVTAVPVNGQTYTASTAFGSGTAIETEQYVVNTTGVNRTFTDLDPATTYYFRVYDYDVDANGYTYYLTSSYSEAGRNTAVAPTTPVSDLRFENIAGNSVTIKYTQNTSDYRLVVMKEGSAVDALPVDLTTYNGNANFKSGQQITPGNYVLIGGQNTSTVNVTGLTPGSTYHIAVFSFNGNNYPVYLKPGITASVTLPNQPTAPATGFQTSTIEGNSFRTLWSGGDGARRIMIARKGAAVTATPVDGTTYNADINFLSGTEILPGQFVVYDGVVRGSNVQNLEPGVTYHFAVFEYNIVAGVPDYLISSSLTGTGTTVAVPTAQTNDISAGNIQNTQATISFSAGNGSSRLFIIRAGSAVNAEPQDYQSYSFSPTYGSQQIGTGNYVVQKTTNNNSFTVTGLSPNTQYFIAAFEFNGATAPVYMKPAATYDFTTTGSGIMPPTVNAGSASFGVPDGNKLNFNWNSGDGTKRIVVMRQGAAVSFTPADGVDHTAEPAFGNGTDLGSGQYVVYNGVQNNVPVTNLAPSTTYHFAVFEYNGTGATTRYLTAGALTASKSTAVTPAAGSTALSGTNNDLTITVNWNAGPGNGRLIVMKEESPVSGTPADLSKYPASLIFGNGAQVAAGEFVVYAGSGNSVTVTGLTNHKTYYYKVFEYNGVDAPVYNTADVVSSSTIVSSTLPLKWLYVTAKEENNAVRIEWGTTQEYYTSHFVVERSEGNNAFVALATIAAKGSSIQNEYSYIDNSKPVGVVSYRIKQVDIDDRFEYSKQVVIKASSQETSLKFYPNPAVGNTRIGLPAGMQQATMNIYSVAGVLVKTAIVNNGEVIFLNGLTHGVYQVVITKDSKQYAHKLVVQ